MNFFELIKHTPLYVWIISGYVTYIGMRALKPHEVYVPFLLGIPCLFLSFQYSFFKTMSQEAFLYWAIAAFVGLLVGVLYGMKRPGMIISERTTILFPGTMLSLILYTSFFISMYYFGFLKAVYPDLFLTLSLYYFSAKGLFTGFLWGKSLYYTYFYLIKH